MRAKQLVLDITLQRQFTFANFVGSAAGQLVAELDRSQPLVAVTGEPFSGKSHLLQAACRARREAGGGAVYLAGLSRLEPPVLRGLAGQDLLCIDDVHEVGGHAGWEEGLFHLLNEVTHTGCSIVFAGLLSALCLPDLTSRLKSATAVTTDRLADDDKVVLLRQRAEAQGLDLAPDVAAYVMRRSARDLRSLLSILDALEAATLERQQRITIPLAREIMADVGVPGV